MALNFSLYSSGLFHLHAGAVSRRSGEGLLAVGASGSGKTTTVLSVIGANEAWQWVSDDTVYLRKSGARVEAAGFPAEFHVARATSEAFPALRAHDLGPLPGHAGKRRIEPRSSYAGRETALVRHPRLLLFPRVEVEGPTRLEPMDESAAYTLLLSSSALGLLQLPGFESHFSAMASLVRGASCFSLLLGRNGLLAPQEVSALVDRAWESV
jgi:hypothetical protein